MAQPKRYTGEKLLIQISDGATPAVFTHDCLINQERGVDYGTQSEENYLPDCEDLDKPAARVIDITGTSVTINGAGIMHSSSWETWWSWWKSGEAKEIKIVENIAAADGGGTETGFFRVTSLSRTGAHKTSVTVSVTLESDGETVRAANAA